MARRSKHTDFSPTIDGFQKWVERAMIQDGSVFTGELLWTSQNIAEVRRAFVDRPDEGEDDFWTKLVRQLQDASGTAQKLMAEMFWVTLLFPSNIKSGTKKRQVSTLWEMSGEQLPPSHPMLSPEVLIGIGSAGMGYNNHRWREIVFLVEFSDRLKRQLGPARREIFGDYDKFLAFVDSVPQIGHRQLRHMFRYFLFPDRVERMSSSGERQKVLKAFRGYSDRDLRSWSDKKLDETLLELRRELEAQYPNERLDFYDSPLVERWRPEEISNAVQEEAGNYESVSGHYWWLNFKPAIFDFLDKPDGFEQMYLTHNEEGNARRLPEAFNAVQPGDWVIGYATSPRKQVEVLCQIAKGVHEDAEEGRAIVIRRVRKFSHSVSLDEIRRDNRLGGLVYLSNPNGTLFDLSKNHFETLLELADGSVAVAETADSYSAADALEELFVSPETLTETLEQLRRKRNIVLQGPPGVGKTFSAKHIAFVLFGVKDPSRLEVVQFHPSTSYEDFVLGLRPAQDGGGGLVMRPGIFHRFCDRARARPNEKFVFIIDEINRGNLPKIFGELLMLIEPDKRGDASSVSLAYHYEGQPKFSVPDNVYLIGTMNTADRSLALVDYALRRRFSFITLDPNFGKKFREALSGHGCSRDLVDRICTRIDALNKLITSDSRSLGRGYQIGHSYFCSESQLMDAEAWYRDVVRFDIKPLLDEYWMDDPKKAEDEYQKLLA